MINEATLDKSINNLPIYSPAISEIITSIKSGPTHGNDIVHLFEKDQKLDRVVVELINSEFYSFGRKVTTLHQAFRIFGTDPVRKLMFMINLINSLRYEIVLDEIKSFWEHSFGVSYIGEFIGKKVGYPNIEKIYIAGLIHDLGKIVLFKDYPVDFMRVINFIKEKKHDFVKAEKELLGITHCEIGLGLAKKLQFPSDLCEVVQHHHNIHEATIDPKLTAIINLADIIVKTHYTGFEMLNFRRIGFMELEEQQSWKVLVNSAHFNLDSFFDEVEDKIDRISEIIDRVFELLDR